MGICSDCGMTMDGACSHPKCPGLRYPSASQIIAILVERLGEPQVIRFSEFDQFKNYLPTLFTMDRDKGELTVDVEKSATQ